MTRKLDGGGMFPHSTRKHSLCHLNGAQRKLGSWASTCGAGVAFPHAVVSATHYAPANPSRFDRLPACARAKERPQRTYYFVGVLLTALRIRSSRDSTPPPGALPGGPEIAPSAILPDFDAGRAVTTALEGACFAGGAAVWSTTGCGAALGTSSRAADGPGSGGDGSVATPSGDALACAPATPERVRGGGDDVAADRPSLVRPAKLTMTSTASAAPAAIVAVRPRRAEGAAVLEGSSAGSEGAVVGTAGGTVMLVGVGIVPAGAETPVSGEGSGARYDHSPLDRFSLARSSRISSASLASSRSSRRMLSRVDILPSLDSSEFLERRMLTLAREFA